MNEVIESMLSRYKDSLKSQIDYENALKEILQEIVLLGLSRSGFFEKAAFYGGTALRLFHKLDRFSEDLDFTLLKPEYDFKFDSYFSIMSKEIKAYGFDFTLERVEKSEDRLTESAFLKTNTQILLLHIKETAHFANLVQKDQKLKIKFEVDVNPAVSFDTEIKTMFLPSPYTVKILKISDLFAGKMHAVLFRKWKERIKGRDFYDLQWYLARSVPLHIEYLNEKIKDTRKIDLNLNQESLVSFFLERIKNIDFEQAKKDVLPFLKDKEQVRFWSVDFFTQLIEKLTTI